MTPTLSEVKSWDVKHLTDAANHWTRAATIWEDHFTQVETGMAHPGGSRWEGEAAEAAQQRAHSDRLIVVPLADQLHNASRIARIGALQLAEAQRLVMRSVEAARNDGFTVGEDFSVTDHRVYTNRAAAAFRQTKAEGYAADLRAAVADLMATDQRIASEISTATTGLDTVRFADPAGAAGSDQKAVTDALLGTAAAGGDQRQPLSDAVLANVAGGGRTAFDAARAVPYWIGQAALGNREDWITGVPIGYASTLIDASSELARPGVKGAPPLVQKAVGEIKLGKLSLGSPGGVGVSGLASGVSFLIDRNKPGMTTAHAAVRNGAALVVGTLASAPFDATVLGIPAGIVVGTASGNVTAALVDLAWDPGDQAQQIVKGFGGPGVGLSHRAMGRAG